MITTKICGITRLEDANFAAENGASAIGYIFYKKSPRYISLNRSKYISDNLSKNIIKVGVFVDHDTKFISEAIKITKLDIIQLHGDESPKFCEQFQVPIIKAFRIKNFKSFSSLNNYNNVSAFLFDSFSKDSHGGTGHTFDWSLIKNTHKIPFILSGGLNLNNVLEAIKIVQPMAIDISSGVELEPGLKDHSKIKRLFLKLKSTQNRGYKFEKNKL